MGNLDDAIAAIDSSLERYPRGRYAAELKAQVAQLRALAAKK